MSNYKGKYKDQYYVLVNELIPEYGICDTTDIELLRCINNCLIDKHESKNNNLNYEITFINNFKKPGLNISDMGLTVSDNTSIDNLASIIDKIMDYLINKTKARQV